jgi:hypothetical protein
MKHLIKTRNLARKMSRSLEPPFGTRHEQLLGNVGAALIACITWGVKSKVEYVADMVGTRLV